MCGILGSVGQKIDSTAIRRALARIAHRGPDDEGIWTEGNVTLAHRRLSIQDLSENGHQPMHSADGRYVITYNGELYNGDELSAKLNAKGYALQTTCDTEILLYLFAAFGIDCLNMLDGIFAFAIYDRHKKQLTFARDRFGVKPLYYYNDGKEFAFASEIKALSGLQGLDLSLKPEVFAQYTGLLWSPDEQTPFRNILKLLPGHYLSIKVEDLHTISPKRFVVQQFTGTYKYQSLAGWIDETEQTLQSAIKKQLVSDAPLGFFLSGGIDSSLLVALTRKVAPGLPVTAFTIDTGDSMKREGFEDDLPYARIAARSFGADLHEIRSAVDIVSEFDKMAWQLDEPQSDPAALFVRMISASAAEKGFKVLMSGMGADEVFSGYRRHIAIKALNKVDSLPAALLKIGLKASSLLGDIPARRIKKILDQAGKPEAERIAGLYQWLDADAAKSLFHSGIRDHINTRAFVDTISKCLSEIEDEKDSLNRILYCEQQTFLPHHNLHYTDKMSMATGVEVRVPYLDTSLTTLAASMPPALKLKGRTTKFMLRALAKKHLPAAIIDRKKTGFGAPVRQWIKNEMKEMVRERLLDDGFYASGIFDRAAVEQLIADNRSGKTDGAYAIYALLTIESWLRQYSVC